MQGFEQLPAMGIPYHLPYYERLLLAQGLQGIEDLRSGYMTRQGQSFERLHEVAARVMVRRGLHVATFRRKAELRRWCFFGSSTTVRWGWWPTTSR